MKYSNSFGNTLFVHAGEKVKKNSKGRYFTDGSYNNDVWNRYLKYCSNLTVIFRRDDKEYTDKDLTANYNIVNKTIAVKELENEINSIGTIISRAIKKRNNELLLNEIDKADTVIIRIPSIVANRVINIAKGKNKRIIAEVVGSSWDSLFYYNLKGKIVAPYYALKQSIAIKKSPYVIYVTKEYLQTKYPTNGKSIACSDASIDHSRFNIDNRLDKIKTMDIKHLKIGTLGSIDAKYKGHAYVIKAISALKPMGVHIEYHLAGQGNKTRLDKLAKKYNVKESIMFDGPISHEKVNDWLDSLDIYVQPSDTEGLSRSLLEAMSRGCPCIVSNVGGNPELIESDYTFRKGKIKELVDIISKIDKKKLSRQAMNNYIKSKSYSNSVLQKRREKFYNEILGHDF